MNIAELKEKLEVTALQLAYPTDAEDKAKRAIDPKTEQPTLWLQHWDNDNRVRIFMHTELATSLKANPMMSNLQIKDNGERVSKTSGKPFHIYTVFAYTAPEFEF